MNTLRPRQKLGKYRLGRLLAHGGFAEVYRALDTIEGLQVALKIPAARLVDDSLLADFRREVRLTAQLDHPNILPIKNADFIDGHFVIVSPLGEGTLGDEFGRRRQFPTLISYARQMIAAVAHAHEHGVVHCDLKPDNFIRFPVGRLRLGDFGIAKLAQRTLAASGSGTVGYLAPEQALGKPSLRSDVFSIGLILYEMFTGQLPEWPFAWPPEHIERIRSKAHPDFVSLIERSLRVDQYLRYESATHMAAAFERLSKRNALAHPGHKKRNDAPRRDWRIARAREFKRRFGQSLALSHACSKCDGRIAESMQACPWCAQELPVWRGPTRFPARCERCGRGRKLDWKSCAWCHGPGFADVSNRSYTDVRYTQRCESCRGPQLPFTRYCPWCRIRVRRATKLAGSRATCGRCGNGVAHEYWTCCPWCSSHLPGARA